MSITLFKQNRHPRPHAMVVILLSIQCLSFLSFWYAVEQSPSATPSWRQQFHNRDLLMAKAKAAAAAAAFSQKEITKGRHTATSATAITTDNTLAMERSRDDGHWCGDWTPRGNLGNPEFDAHSVESISPEQFPSCGLDSKVGSTHEPDASLLFCNPPLKGGDREKLFHRDPAVLALDLKFQSESGHAPLKLDYSIIMPSHNVAEVLNISVPLLCQHTVGMWEIIFVLDQSYDDSLQVLRSILLSNSCIGDDTPGRLIRARVLVQPTSIFETSSDNLGFTLATAVEDSSSSSAPFLIAIQSDMLVAQTGWNRDFARPLLQYGDLFAVGGRCGHRNGPVGEPHMLGRCDRDFANLDTGMQKHYEHQLVVVGTTCRGPIIFRSDVFKSLGFLDEVNFHQGNDDHDLFRRALHKGWHVAFRYAHVYSPLNLSPAREAKFNAKTPDHGAKQSHWYSVFRKEIQQEDHHCDPDVPLKAYASSPGIPHSRSLDPLPEGSDLRTLPLSPLPVHITSREEEKYS